MTPSALVSSLNEVCERLLSLDLAVEANSHKIASINKDATALQRVTWVAQRGEPLVDYPYGSLSEYFVFLRNREFSSILFDGSILQMSYDFRHGEVVAHRLCYVPSPVAIAPERLGDTPVEDQVRDFLEMLDCSQREKTDRMLLKPYLRFDYDKEQQDDDHSPSHCHLAYQDCRIPVKSPLSPRQFFVFLFTRLYRDVGDTDWLTSDVIHAEFDASICSGDSAQLHISWRTAS